MGTDTKDNHLIGWKRSKAVCVY
uniref:Uncharacterized protein n=1 Tax=Anguilla anguilla TaxID=7936 RepID=A0A0E9SRI7_ANGAN